MTTTNENGKLAARLIRITNIGGVRGTLEIPLGDITYLEGDNGLGKSSALNGVAALCGAPVTDLLTQGEEEGEAYLELTDDTWFRRRITAKGGNSLTAGHPEQGSIGKAAAWLKATLSAAALSPAEFLQADDVKAAEYILRTAPLTVTAEEVAEAIGEEVEAPAIDVNGHALTVLDRAFKMLYDMRTGENRVAKEARTTAEQLQKSIPEDVADPEQLQARVKALSDELSGVMDSQAEAAARAESDARTKAEAAISGALKEARAQAQEVRRLEAALEAARSALQEQESAAEALTVRREEDVKAAVEEAKAPFRETQAKLGADLTAAREAHGAAVRAHGAVQNTRALILQHETAAEVSTARSQALTRAMARLDALKAAKAAELPVEGVTVQEGKLYIDGVPAHRANTARRAGVAIEASGIQKARVPFVFADDLEHLSTKTRTQVEAECRRRGIQILGARVTDGEELVVRSVEEPEPEAAR